jgi:predicted transcriptional regulator
MADKPRVKSISLYITPSTFRSLFQRIKGSKQEYDFSDLANLRHILSNEKARLLYTVKHQNPESIYHLAKLLKRDFKSVIDDIKILEKFGFLELKPIYKGRRRTLKPLMLVDTLTVSLNL